MSSVGLSPWSPLLPSRRNWLRVGLGSLFAGSLAQLFAARAQASPAVAAAGGLPSIRSCIVVFFYGGPSHLDTWDPKPLAPREVRGEFAPISTSTPGIHVSEHLPKCARVMHKLALVRGLHHPMRNHNSAAVEALCGRTPLSGDLELLADDRNSFPCYGSVLNHQLATPGTVPGHVALPHLMYNVVVLPGQTSGFLGPAHNPFQVTRDPSEPGFQVDELQLGDGVSLGRLATRRALMDGFENFDPRGLRPSPEASMSIYQQQAFDLVASEEVRRAFDISQEADSAKAACSPADWSSRACVSSM
jgi:hypothetical protein